MGKFSDFWGTLFGDDSFRQAQTRILEHAALADLLPWRVYDPEKRLYHNDRTTGFILEIAPQIASEEVVGNLHSALLTSMPAQAGFQVISWSSPDLRAPLNAWAAQRSSGGELTEAMAKGRVEHLNDLRFGSEHPIKAIPTNRRAFVTGWIEGDASMSKLAGLEEYRRAILGALGLPQPSGMEPTAFLQLLEEILHAEQWGGLSQASYDDQIPLNAQVPGATLHVAPGFIQFGGDPMVAAGVTSVARFPKEWSAALGTTLLGEPEKISERPHGPVLSTLTAVSIPAQKAASDMLSRRGKLEHSRKTGFNRFVSDFEGKAKEYQSLSEELESGERLFQTVMSVIGYTKGSGQEARIASSELAKIYRRVGFGLRQEKYLQLPLLINSLPLGSSEKYMNTLTRLQRMRLLKARALTSVAPVSGEWKGNSAGPGMLLVGRQGQIFTWSNFQSEGNYNVAVVGKSGAGKSVFMQELITSIYANGGRALVIDDGYSFQTTCDILGGRHIAFDGDQELRLNPFSMLQSDKMQDGEAGAPTDYAAEAVDLITRVVASMAALGAQREGRVEGIEEKAISDAVFAVWNEKGPAGEITDVYLKLKARVAADPRLEDVCTKLKSFTQDGVYGKYFQGQATVDVETPFTVVELSNLKSQPDLEQVVLQIIMFLGTELMFKTDRSVPVAILIDEAWDLLKGAGTAKFIEGVVRRARKYTGALITGTQSVDDYFQNQAAEVCLQNSDWTVFLAQNPETIDRLEENKRLSIPAGFGAKLKSITSVPGQFSEMAVKGPGGWFFGRLMLDPFSLAVFSSKGATVEHLKRRRAAGMSTVEALKDMVAKGDVA